MRSVILENFLARFARPILRSTRVWVCAPQRARRYGRWRAWRELSGAPSSTPTRASSPQAHRLRAWRTTRRGGGAVVRRERGSGGIQGHGVQGHGVQLGVWDYGVRQGCEGRHRGEG